MGQVPVFRTMEPGVRASNRSKTPGRAVREPLGRDDADGHRWSDEERQCTRSADADGPLADRTAEAEAAVDGALGRRQRGDRVALGDAALEGVRHHRAEDPAAALGRSNGHGGDRLGVDRRAVAPAQRLAEPGEGAGRPGLVDGARRGTAHVGAEPGLVVDDEVRDHLRGHLAAGVWLVEPEPDGLHPGLGLGVRCPLLVRPGREGAQLVAVVECLVAHVLDPIGVG